MHFKKLLAQEQSEKFDELSGRFQEVLAKLKLGPGQNGLKIKSEWNDIVAKLYSLYDQKLRKDFLNNSVVTHALFMNSQGDLMAHQIDFLKKYFTVEQLKETLLESPVGCPPKSMTWEFDTTHNSIHHLYHMARYERKTGKKIAAAKRVIEWGGGYGNFCKLVCSLPESVLSTYTIIDIPEISALQWIYLSSIFGEEKIKLVTEQSGVEDGKINLVSLPNLSLVDGGYDLFVSTWALSESPTEMHDLVNQKNWFDVNSLLMAIHQCGDHIPFMTESTNIGLLAKKFGALIEDVQIIPGKNYYIFK